MRFAKAALCAAALLAASSAATASAGYVTHTDAHGRAWLAASLVTNNSWNDVAQTCSALTGACAGSLGSILGPQPTPIDVTGYAWATRDEVRELFYDLFELPAGTLDTYSGSATYAAHFDWSLEPTWASTYSDTFTMILHGISRDAHVDDSGSPKAWAPLVSYTNPDSPLGNCCSATFSLTASLPLAQRDGLVGVWLHRPAEVPAPVSVALLALGLTLLTRVRSPSSAPAATARSAGTRPPAQA